MARHDEVMKARTIVIEALGAEFTRQRRALRADKSVSASERKARRVAIWAAYEAAFDYAIEYAGKLARS